MPQTTRPAARRTPAMVPLAATILVLAVLILAVLTGEAPAREPRMVPVTVDGERVRLEMRVYEPPNGAPAAGLS